jgi:glutamate 5-kinase
LFIDQGAYKALTRPNRASLLPVGVVHVEGSFLQTEAVSITVVERNEDGYKIVDSDVGRAIVNYNSGEINEIKGLQSSEIAGKIGYADYEWIADRDNMAFYRKHESHYTV